MDYQISRQEISRRKRAYATLSTSLMVGLILASVIFAYPISIQGYFIVLISIILLGLFSFRFFHQLTKSQIHLSPQSLQRITPKNTEVYSLDQISKVKVKWTTHHSIREIYIWLNNGQSIYLTSLNDFEKFNQEFQSHLDKLVVIQEIFEPLDYDHPLFYSLLGLPISAFGVLLFKSLITLSYQYTQIGIFAFSLYLLIFGTYFIISKPISKRSGKKTISSDYFIGGLMIITSTIFVLLFFFRF